MNLAVVMSSCREVELRELKTLMRWACNDERILEGFRNMIRWVYLDISPPLSGRVWGRRLQTCLTCSISHSALYPWQQPGFNCDIHR